MVLTRFHLKRRAVTEKSNNVIIDTLILKTCIYTCCLRFRASPAQFSHVAILRAALMRWALAVVLQLGHFGVLPWDPVVLQWKNFCFKSYSRR